MDPLEAFLVALITAVLQSLAPLIVQQSQQPSTAQDGFTDAELQNRIKNAIENP